MSTIEVKLRRRTLSRVHHCVRLQEGPCCDYDLQLLVRSFPNITELHLSDFDVISGQGMATLSACARLQTLVLQLAEGKCHCG